MEITISSVYEDVARLKKEVALLKRLMSEGELTDYAKKELAKARAESEGSYTSLTDL
jgi:hypothetical protein